jgi:addiction module RelE/StbE family toxin
MTIQYDPDFLGKLKSVNVRIRKSFKERIDLFRKDPHNRQLNNHALKNEYEGYWSIDITNDYRALYEEVDGGDEPIAYFSILGTHKELYEKTSHD